MINRIALGVFLGIITTIVVAWGLWMRIDPRSGPMVGSLRWDTSDSWTYWVFHQPGATLVQRISQRAERNAPGLLRHSPSAAPSELPGWSAVRRKPSADELKFTGSTIEDARGWPFLSLYSESRVPPQIMSMPNNTTLILQSQVDKGPLPLRVIWPGFAADSAIFAAVWALVLIAPMLVARRLRERRGACTSCGYDLRFTSHSTNCPECGAGINAARPSEPSIANRQS